MIKLREGVINGKEKREIYRGRDRGKGWIRERGKRKEDGKRRGGRKGDGKEKRNGKGEGKG